MLPTSLLVELDKPKRGISDRTKQVAEENDNNKRLELAVVLAAPPAIKLDEVKCGTHTSKDD